MRVLPVARMNKQGCVFYQWLERTSRDACVFYQLPNKLANLA
ncbi:MAG: hypothetical protein ACPGWR_07380 [Ardenticatenaceae bacterium]